VRSKSSSVRGSLLVLETISRPNRHGIVLQVLLFLAAVGEVVLRLTACQPASCVRPFGPGRNMEIERERVRFGSEDEG